MIYVHANMRSHAHAQIWSHMSSSPGCLKPVSRKVSVLHPQYDSYMNFMMWLRHKRCFLSDDHAGSKFVYTMSSIFSAIFLISLKRWEKDSLRRSLANTIIANTTSISALQHVIKLSVLKDIYVFFVVSGIFGKYVSLASKNVLLICSMNESRLVYSLVLIKFRKWSLSWLIFFLWCLRVR